MRPAFRLSAFRMFVSYHQMSTLYAIIYSNFPKAKSHFSHIRIYMYWCGWCYCYCCCYRLRRRRRPCCCCRTFTPTISFWLLVIFFSHRRKILVVWHTFCHRTLMYTHFVRSNAIFNLRSCSWFLALFQCAICSMVGWSFVIVPM